MDPGQLERRRKGIGGSDIAAILGIHPYKGPLDVYAEKLGIEDPNAKEAKDKEVHGFPSEAAYWGTMLEAAVARRYEQEEDVVLLEVDPKDLPIVHPKVTYFGCSPDRLVKGKTKGWEGKTAGAHMKYQWGPSESQEIPDYYMTQPAWYMPIFGYQHWDLSVLIGGQEYRVYRLERDMELEEMLYDAAHDFWNNHVLKEVPPQLTGHEKDDKAIRKIFARSIGDIRLATPEERNLMATLQTRREQKKAVEEGIVVVENNIKFLIGDGEGIEGPGFKCTFKSGKDSNRLAYKNALLEIQKRVGGEQIQNIITFHTNLVHGGRRFLPKWKE